MKDRRTSLSRTAGIGLTGFLCCLLGCGGFFVPKGGGGAGGTAAGYLYVANSSRGTLGELAISTTGKLSNVANSPLALNVVATALAIDPANKFLYVGAANGIYLYAVQSDGSVAVQNGGSAVATDVLPSAMQVDATGGYLLAAGLSNGGAAIGIYQINSSTGVLSRVNGSPLGLYTGPGGNQNLVVPVSMLITPANTSVYVSLGTQGVQVLTLGAGGALNAGSSPTLLRVRGTASSTSDQGLASDPASKYLFVTEINNGLRVLTIGNGGSLTEVTGSPFKTGTGPVAVVLDQAGTDVYVANKGDGTITGFNLGAGGALTEIAGSPFSSGGSTPVALAMTTKGTYLAALNNGGSNDLQLFSFDATTAGKLIAAANAQTGTQPAQASLIVTTH